MRVTRKQVDYWPRSQDRQHLNRHILSRCAGQRVARRCHEPLGVAPQAESRQSLRRPSVPRGWIRGGRMRNRTVRFTEQSWLGRRFLVTAARGARRSVRVSLGTPLSKSFTWATTNLPGF